MDPTFCIGYVKESGEFPSKFILSRGESFSLQPRAGYYPLVIIPSLVGFDGYIDISTKKIKFVDRNPEDYDPDLGNIEDNLGNTPIKALENLLVMK